MTEDELISKQKAIELIENADFGHISIATIDHIPAIGDIDASERKWDMQVKHYKFGKYDDEGYLQFKVGDQYD